MVNRSTRYCGGVSSACRNAPNERPLLHWSAHQSFAVTGTGSAGGFTLLEMDRHREEMYYAPAAGGTCVGLLDPVPYRLRPGGRIVEIRNSHSRTHTKNGGPSLSG